MHEPTEDSGPLPAAYIPDGRNKFGGAASARQHRALPKSGESLFCRPVARYAAT